MHNWVEFWFVFFWLSLTIFVFNYANFLFFFFFTEIVWLILFVLATTLSIFTDDINLLGLTFFFLGLAGLEFALGFILIILLKSFKISLNILQNEKTFDYFYKNYKSSIWIDNYFWLK